MRDSVCEAAYGLLIDAAPDRYCRRLRRAKLDRTVGRQGADDVYTRAVWDKGDALVIVVRDRCRSASVSQALTASGSEWSVNGIGS